MGRGASVQISETRTMDMLRLYAEGGKGRRRHCRRPPSERFNFLETGARAEKGPPVGLILG
jgi:hypothetical protein